MAQDQEEEEEQAQEPGKDMDTDKEDTRTMGRTRSIAGSQTPRASCSRTTHSMRHKCSTNTSPGSRGESEAGSGVRVQTAG